MFKIDPSRLDVAREFKAMPFGEHSPELQYVLNYMRTRVTPEFEVLVMTEPGKRWVLAYMPTGGGSVPKLTNRTFDRLEDVTHVDQARCLLAWKVDLRDVARDHDLRAEAEAREKHLHLLRAGVLGLV